MPDQSMMRETNAMKFENTLLELDRMHEALNAGRSFHKNGIRLPNIEQIERARKQMDDSMRAILQAYTVKVNTARSLIKTDRDLTIGFEALDIALKDGTISAEEFHKRRDSLLSSCAQKRRSLTNDLDKSAKAINDSIIAINESCKNLDLPPVFSEKSAPSNISLGLVMEYAFFSDTYMKTLERQIEKMKRGDTGPFILSAENSVTSHHMDITDKAMQIAADAAKQIMDLDAYEKKYAGVTYADYRPDVNIHVVKVLPPGIEFKHPVSKWIEVMDDRTSKLMKKPMTSYEPDPPIVDEGGHSTIYVLQNEYEKLSKNYTLMNKGEVFFHSSTPGPGEWDSSRFKNKVKEALMEAGYDVAAPESQTYDERTKALEKGFKNGTLDPVGVEKYFRLRENLSRYDLGKRDFWKKERANAMQTFAKKERKTIKVNQVDISL